MFVDGRGGRIRTADPPLPKQMRYLTVLQPDKGEGQSQNSSKSKFH